MKVYSFRCPKCGNTKLDEVLENVIQIFFITSIKEIDENTVALDYGNSCTDGGNVKCYRCSKCGYVLKNKYIPVKTPEDLKKWLDDRFYEKKELE